MLRRVSKLHFFMALWSIILSPVAFAQPAEHASPNPSPSQQFLEQVLPKTSYAAWEKMFSSDNLGLGDDAVCSWRDVAEVKAAWDRAVSRHLDIAAVAAAVHAAIEEQASREDLSVAMAFNASPLGAKKLMLENSAATMSEEELSAGLHQAATALKNPRRKSLIARYVTASRQAEFMTDLKNNVALSVALGGLQAADGKEQHRSIEDIIRELDTDSSPDDMDKAMQLNTAVLYRWLTNQELEQLIKVAETPISQRLSKIITTAFQRAIREQSLSIGKEFARELRSERL